MCRQHKSRVSPVSDTMIPCAGSTGTELPRLDDTILRLVCVDGPSANPLHRVMPSSPGQYQYVVLRSLLPQKIPRPEVGSECFVIFSKPCPCLITCGAKQRLKPLALISRSPTCKLYQAETKPSWKEGTATKTAEGEIRYEPSVHPLLLVGLL